MPNTPSAIKMERVATKRRTRNRATRSALATHVKKARLGVAKPDSDEAASLVRLAAKKLDQAAVKGVIHKNQAARRKGRLMHQLSLALRAPAPTEEAPARPKRATRARQAGTTTPRARTRAPRSQPSA